MNKQTLQFEYMSLDDFEEMLADKPADERWELIGGQPGGGGGVDPLQRRPGRVAEPVVGVGGEEGK